MPTAAERTGDLSASTRLVVDPAKRRPLPRPGHSGHAHQSAGPSAGGSLSPAEQHRHQPLQLPGSGGGRTAPGRIFRPASTSAFEGNSLGGSFALQSTRTDNPNLFGFLDTGRVFGWDSAFQYSRAWNRRTLLNASVQFSRLNSSVTPWFSHLRNISKEAGILGNNQEPVNWGPPALQFASGISALSEPHPHGFATRPWRSQLMGMWGVAGTTLTFGYAHRLQQFNVPRATGPPAERLLSPEPLPATIWPRSCSAFPTLRPSHTGMPTSTYARPRMSPSSTTIGE